MSRISVNPALVYSQSTKISQPKENKDLISENVPSRRSEDKVSLSEKSKDLNEKLSSAEKVLKIHRKKFGDLKTPAIYFVSGFDWFGASSVKGNYDGIRDMSKAIEGAKHFSWDEIDEILDDIKKHEPNQPLILVGHSFGGDGVVDIANQLNTIDNGFRKVDLMVTLDSVGLDNDLIPQNVSKNLNFMAQGPYSFLNDGPNVAVNYETTLVSNFLRHEEHAQLDDTISVQVKILDAIEDSLKAHSKVV